MRVKQLLEQLASYLNEERRAQIKKYDSMQKVLRKLKKEAKALNKRLENEQDAEVREHLLQEIQVITAQRKKGVSILKEIKQSRKADSQ